MEQAVEAESDMAEAVVWGMKDGTTEVEMLPGRDRKVAEEEERCDAVSKVAVQKECLLPQRVSFLVHCRARLFAFEPASTFDRMLD
jgi:hypothetical protein